MRRLTSGVRDCSDARPARTPTSHQAAVGPAVSYGLPTAAESTRSSPVAAMKPRANARRMFGARRGNRAQARSMSTQPVHNDSDESAHAQGMPGHGRTNVQRQKRHIPVTMYSTWSSTWPPLCVGWLVGWLVLHRPPSTPGRTAGARDARDRRARHRDDRRRARRAWPGQGEAARRAWS